MNNPQSPEGTPPGGPRLRPGDLVRVWPLEYGEFGGPRVTDERLTYLAFVETSPSRYRDLLVRHADKLGHTAWVRADQLELVQRGDQ